MKGVITGLVITCFAAILFAGAGYVQGQNVELEGRITLSGAWALYPMALKWAEEFQKIHPKVKIDVSAGGAGKGMADCLAKIADLGMVSRDINAEEEKKGAWALPVVKDAVLATVNANNPVIKGILVKGLTKKIFADIFVTGDIKTWGQVLGTDEKQPVIAYTRSDACGAGETWAKYLGKKQEDLVGIGVYGDPGVAEAVKKDVCGIGFNNVNYVYDAKTKAPIDGIRVVPIDINGDGKIDPDEDFYNDRATVMAAIARGIYPSPPARDLYFVSGGKPERKEVREFLRWVLTDGQKYVPETGYINVPDDKIKKDLEKLGEN
ncbi:MAG: extracellular solute-binding protein [Candidatus Omnitrophica bacterium]|nr:extracellular solute-binding protein [Candidatus Omnitrophota bacterium]